MKRLNFCTVHVLLWFCLLALTLNMAACTTPPGSGAEETVGDTTESATETESETET